jgi:hypothetical protein
MTRCRWCEGTGLIGWPLQFECRECAPLEPARHNPGMNKIGPGLYVHHKDGRYRVLHIALDSTNARALPDGSRPQVVVYLSLTTGEICVRDLAEFAAEIWGPADSGPCPRFRLVDPFDHLGLVKK